MVSLATVMRLYYYKDSYYSYRNPFFMNNAQRYLNYGWGYGLEQVANFIQPALKEGDGVFTHKAPLMNFLIKEGVKGVTFYELGSYDCLMKEGDLIIFYEEDLRYGNSVELYSIISRSGPPIKIASSKGINYAYVYIIDKIC